jgi:hypothetical protein
VCACYDRRYLGITSARTADGGSAAFLYRIRFLFWRVKLGSIDCLDPNPDVFRPDTQPHPPDWPERGKEALGRAAPAMTLTIGADLSRSGARFALDRSHSRRHGTLGLPHGDGARSHGAGGTLAVSPWRGVYRNGDGAGQERAACPYAHRSRRADRDDGRHSGRPRHVRRHAARQCSVAPGNPHLSSR